MTEREEALRLAYEADLFRDINPLKREDHEVLDSLVKLIRLARAQPQGEPVGIVQPHRIGPLGNYYVEWTGNPPPSGTPVYTSPPAQAVPEDVALTQAYIRNTGPMGAQMSLAEFRKAVTELLSAAPTPDDGSICPDGTARAIER